MEKKADIVQTCIASHAWFSGFKNCYTFHYVELSGEADGTDEKAPNMCPHFCKKCYNDGMYHS